MLLIAWTKQKKRYTVKQWLDIFVRIFSASFFRCGEKKNALRRKHFFCKSFLSIWYFWRDGKWRLNFWIKVIFHILHFAKYFWTWQHREKFVQRILRILDRHTAKINFAKISALKVTRAISCRHFTC